MPNLSFGMRTRGARALSRYVQDEAEIPHRRSISGQQESVAKTRLLSGMRKPSSASLGRHHDETTCSAGAAHRVAPAALNSGRAQGARMTTHSSEE